MRIIRYTSRQVYARPCLLDRLRHLTNQGPDYGDPWGSSLIKILNKEVSGIFFLAWKNSKVIAQCFVQSRSDRQYQVNIYVDPLYRKKGLGKRLAFKAKRFAEKHNKKIYYGTGTRPFNRVYEGFGFINDYEYHE